MVQRSCAFLILTMFIFLMACRPATVETSVSATVEKKVSEAVAMTVAALPTLTQYVAQLPYPTATSYATPSPYPTPTLYEPATVYPTYTLYPTFTPTGTATPTLQASPIVRPTVFNTPSSITKQEMLRIMEATQANLGLLMGMIDSASANGSEVECKTATENYQALVALPTIVIPEGNVSLRQAFDALNNAVNLIVTHNELIEDCGRKIATDGAGSIPATAWNYFRIQLNLASTNLDNARRNLLISADS
jgi:hypothetical protein